MGDSVLWRHGAHIANRNSRELQAVVVGTTRSLCWDRSWCSLLVRTVNVSNTNRCMSGEWAFGCAVAS